MTKEQADRLLELFDTAIMTAVKCCEEAFDENSNPQVARRVANQDRHADEAFRKFVEGLIEPR